MQRIEENKLEMFESVQAVLNKNNTAVATLPALAEAKTEFTDLIADIIKTDKEYGTATVGKVAVKNSVENELIDVLLPLKGALASLARKTKNTELALLVKFTKTDLQRLGDTDLKNKVSTILEIIEANKTTLANYNVDDAEINDLKEKAATFSNATANNKTSFTGKVGARVSLTELFDNADEVLKVDLDNLMLRMKKNYPDFYIEYQAARVTKDLGGKHKSDEEETPPPPDTPTPPAQ
ncbi:MAG: hypothetical protein Q8N83_15300 [Ignavibacteria bacterium]|nr:hypothetical protein [Ignavibacteria bacterium]